MTAQGYSLFDKTNKTDLDTAPLLDDEAVEGRRRLTGAVIDDIRQQPGEFGGANQLGHVRVSKVEVVVTDACCVDLDRVQDGNLRLVTLSAWDERAADDLHPTRRLHPC